MADQTHDRGPGESFAFPEKLTAHVVEPGPAPRIHGFAVHTDLARHCSAGEVMLLTLLGEEPSVEAGRAFEVALTFLAPLSVGDAAVHAAVLARITAGRRAAVLGTGAIALAERSASIVDRMAPFLAWLDGAEGPPPGIAAGSPEDAPALDHLRTAVAATGLTVPGLDQRLSLEAAILAVLRATGLKAPWQLDAVLFLAAVPALIAEAVTAKPFALKAYPFNLPTFLYEGKKP